MRRFPVLVFSGVTAAVTCCGLVAGARPAIAATPPAAGHHAATATAAGVTWNTAEEVPGLAALNTGEDAQVTSVSCASAGNCTAGGSYSGSSSAPAFVVDETGGTWGTAKEVRGTAALTGRNAQVNSVSCASVGNCAAGGTYTDSSGHTQAFVVDETGGTWGKAQEVPGSAALNTGGPTGGIDAEVASVSCASAGHCAAGGWYSDSSGHTQAFVVDETGGTWGKAQEVPGSGALNTGGVAEVNSVSCASAGYCTAGGEDQGSSGGQAFVVDEVGGTWGKAQEVPGLAALNTGMFGATVNSVSCASAGYCTAGGEDQGSSGIQAFVVDEVGGTWGTAQEVPGLAALNTGGVAEVNSVSCAAKGNCAAAGIYSVPSAQQVFVVDEAGGTWGKAQEVPGSGALNTGGVAEVNSVSCAAAGYCAAVGDYATLSSGPQAFVDATRASPTSTSISLSAGKVTYGHEQAEHVSVAVTSKGGTPGGKVTVKSGATTVCTITLGSGKGNCTLSATKLHAATWHLTAAYTFSADFAASTSAAKTLTVSKASTRTTLSLSVGKVTYGHEQAERLSFTVSPRYSGAPGGTVTIKNGTVAECTIKFSSGRGSCTLTAKRLSVGAHTLDAVYSGSGNFTGSTSARKTLTVVK